MNHLAPEFEFTHENHRFRASGVRSQAYSVTCNKKVSLALSVSHITVNSSSIMILHLTVTAIEIYDHAWEHLVKAVVHRAIYNAEPRALSPCLENTRTTVGKSIRQIVDEKTKNMSHGFPGSGKTFILQTSSGDRDVSQELFSRTLIVWMQRYLKARQDQVQCLSTKHIW
ncbi:hypothetical protein EV702DRAFT_1107957 [Suillus placidus]|uniref:Uncharacterized protein n=1 Tax=Suillus placidus TaxID=48579 RepID=A0A9P6ZUR5_9AGAM|nr:hypothetical protein EV702DRAFT_1107957 [Suillus placidus]